MTQPTTDQTTDPAPRALAGHMLPTGAFRLAPIAVTAPFE